MRQRATPEAGTARLGCDFPYAGTERKAEIERKHSTLAFP
jgi:hypothetical protein